MSQEPRQAVKKVSSNTVLGFEVVVTPNDLVSLRRELSESLSEFGLTLKRAIDPKAERGFTRQYVSRLEKGKDTITPEIKAAFMSIAAALDGAPANTGGTVPATVLVAPGIIPDGVTPLIPAGAKTIKCAAPGCPVWFIRLHPRQKFHDASCRTKGKI